MCRYLSGHIWIACTSHRSIVSSLCCREKKMSRTSALKVLDHGMIGPEGADNCHKFVDILGLRTIFPLFMKTPKKMKKTGASEREHEGQLLITAWFLPKVGLSSKSVTLFWPLIVVWHIGSSSVLESIELHRIVALWFQVLNRHWD